MSHAVAKDGTKIYYESTGDGPAVLFLHEFAGDVRSWEAQVRRLSRQYRCITFNARGYPPSDAPESADSYSQDIAVGDAVAVLDACGGGKAHVVGHSMGAYTALHIGLRHPGRVLSVTVAGCGWGSDPAVRDQSRALTLEIADMFATKDIAESAAHYADFPMRHRYRDKDPRGWAEFSGFLAEHSGHGSAMTMANVQMKRPTLFEMRADLEQMDLPLLVIVGDEDEACIEGSLMLKKAVPGAGLYMAPWASHTINSEEPDLFNRALGDFLATVACRLASPS